MDWTTAVLLLVLRITPPQPRIAVSVLGFSAPRLTGPGTTTLLDVGALTGSPALVLDDTLRSVPGFSLFRRSSSRVANPTTQGVTLRGMAASGASRASVFEDGVPLNDPFGGWVYWNRVPAASLVDVEVARGPAGDVHADSLGGAIRIRTYDAYPAARLVAEGGSDATARLSGHAGRNVGGGAGTIFGAGEWSTTDGFVIVAPEARGPVDTNASSRHASGRAGAGFSTSGVIGRIRASLFHEERGNGTPFQQNETRIRQVSGGLSGSAGRGGWSARAHASSQDYEQTFSAVLPGRQAERPTSEQHVDAAWAGGGIEWARSSDGASMALIGSGRYIEADLRDRVLPASNTPEPPLTSARQFFVSGAGQVSLHRWTAFSIAAGARVETWRSEEVTGSGEQTQATFVSPRVALSWRASAWPEATIAFQSAARAPTLNELYRQFRVGNVVTLANAGLRPEKARGLEASVTWRRGLHYRAVGFITNVTDAVVNVTLPPAGATIVRQRRNAARIRAAGLELEIEGRLGRIVSLTASSGWTHSAFAAGPLDGLRVPQVPRLQAALGPRGTWPRARIAADWRYIGTQFDDDRNDFELARSSVFDVRAGWFARRNLELFAALENVLDEEQDVGRTPIRTIGLPRTMRIGLRVNRP